jgi:xylan 1,4-beta-xylosidase
MASGHAVRGALLLTLASALAGPAWSAATVTADFSVGTDPPLVKSKLNLYSTAIPDTAMFERDAGHLYELPCESIRIEHNWGLGQALSGSVDRVSGRIEYDWSLLDHWVRLVTSAGLSFHTAYDYTPFALGPVAQDPPPPGPWGEVVARAAAHMRGLGLPVSYHEVWNEPDYRPAFFRGTADDYYRLYGATARAVRAQDADAKVGGPAVAHSEWYDAFVDYVRTNRLPLDFFSFHQYGSASADRIEAVAASLSRDYRFATTEMLMDEYSPYKTFGAGPQDTFRGATALLDSVLAFLEHPELTSLYWAQYSDPAPGEHIGLVSYDGHVRATFNAAKLYGRLPAERRAVQVDGAAVTAVASSDAHRAGVLVLNRTGADQTVTVALHGAPFAQGSVSVYPVDAAHNSYGDGAGEALAPSEAYEGVSLEGWAGRGRVPSEATLYMEIEDGTGATDCPAATVARIVRANRYYPSRTTASYSDLDRRTWIVRQGMAGSDWADQEVGATLEALPEVLTFALRTEGALEKRDANSCLAVRLDYATADGYAKSVLFHGAMPGAPDLYDARREAPMPFGTRRQADQVIGVQDLRRFEIWPMAYAPDGWTGRADLTFVLQNAGSAARVRWTVGRRSRVASAIACGASSPVEWFSADRDYTDGSTFVASSGVLTAGVAAPAPEALYRSERYGRSAFSYSVPGLAPGRTYLLRLHFSENYWYGRGKRLFGVLVSGRPLLDRFDIYAAAGGSCRAVTREFFVAADARGYLNVRFVPWRDNCKVNGIEVCETLGPDA